MLVTCNAGWPLPPAANPACTVCPAGWAASGGEHDIFSLVLDSIPFRGRCQQFCIVHCTALHCTALQSTPQRARCAARDPMRQRCVFPASLRFLSYACRAPCQPCVLPRCIAAGPVAGVPAMPAGDLCLLVGIVLLQKLHCGHLCSFRWEGSRGHHCAGRLMGVPSFTYVPVH